MSYKLIKLLFSNTSEIEDYGQVQFLTHFTQLFKDIYQGLDNFEITFAISKKSLNYKDNYFLCQQKSKKFIRDKPFVKMTEELNYFLSDSSRFELETFLNNENKEKNNNSITTDFNNRDASEIEKCFGIENIEEEIESIKNSVGIISINNTEAFENNPFHDNKQIVPYTKSNKIFQFDFEIPDKLSFVSMKLIYLKELEKSLIIMLDEQGMSLMQIKFINKNEKNIIKITVKGNKSDSAHDTNILIEKSLFDFRGKISYKKFKKDDFFLQDFDKIQDIFKKYDNELKFLPIKEDIFLLSIHKNINLIYKKVQNFKRNFVFDLAVSNDMIENNFSSRNSYLIQHINKKYSKIIENKALEMELFDLTLCNMNKPGQFTEILKIKVDGETAKCHEFKSQILILMNNIKQRIIKKVKSELIEIVRFDLIEMKREIYENNYDIMEFVYKEGPFLYPEEIDLYLFGTNEKFLIICEQNIKQIILEYCEFVMFFKVEFEFLALKLNEIEREIKNSDIALRNKDFKISSNSNNRSLIILCHRTDEIRIKECLNRFIENNYLEFHEYQFNNILTFREFMRVYSINGNSNILLGNKRMIYLDYEKIKKSSQFIYFSCLASEIKEIEKLLKEKEENIESTYVKIEKKMSMNMAKYLISIPEQILSKEQEFNVSIDFFEKNHNQQHLMTKFSLFIPDYNKIELSLYSGFPKIGLLVIPIDKNFRILVQCPLEYQQGLDKLIEESEKNEKKREEIKKSVFVFRLKSKKEKDKKTNTRVICYKLQDMSIKSNYIDFYEDLTIKTGLKKVFSLLKPAEIRLSIIIKTYSNTTLFEDLYEVLYDSLKQFNSLKYVGLYNESNKTMLEFSQFIREKRDLSNIKTSNNLILWDSSLIIINKFSSSKIIENAFQRFRENPKKYLFWFKNKKMNSDQITLQFNLKEKMVLIQEKDTPNPKYNFLITWNTFFKETNPVLFPNLKLILEDYNDLNFETQNFYAELIDKQNTNPSLSNLKNSTQILEINFQTGEIIDENKNIFNLIRKVKKSQNTNLFADIIIEELLDYDCSHLESEEETIFLKGAKTNISSFLHELEILYKDRKIIKNWKNLTPQEYQLLNQKFLEHIKNKKNIIIRKNYENEIEIEASGILIDEISQDLHQISCINKANFLLYPKIWTKNMASNLLIVELKNDSIEFSEIKQLIFGGKIEKIQRIQNNELYKLFYQETISFEDKKKNNFNERYFFASQKYDPKKIFSLKNEGFDPRIFSNNDFYGEGIYFFQSCLFALKNAFINEEKEAEILIARVLVGKTLKNPQPNSKIKKAPDDYDSISGKIDGEETLVIYEANKAYPEYLVTIKL